MGCMVEQTATVGILGISEMRLEKKNKDFWVTGLSKQLLWKFRFFPMNMLSESFDLNWKMFNEL